MKRITGKDVRKQLTYDLIGKDSYRGITLTYGWLANQFGHFGLGFIPTTIVYGILVNCCGPSNHAGLKSAMGVGIFWTLFETYNVLAPILKNDTRYVFKPDWVNVVYDTITDLLFFWTGAFTACLIINWSYQYWYIPLILLTLIFCHPAPWWYRTKMYQQLAEFPIQSRLSQFLKPSTPEMVEKVLEFVNRKPGCHHLFITGAYQSGKTSLGVSIANEHSIKHWTCTYTTAIKLFSFGYDDPPVPGTPASPIWNWRNADVLLIDDINPGPPISQQMITADTFLRLFNNPRHGKINLEALANKKLIWVIGATDGEGLTAVNSWKQMLAVAGIVPDSVTEIHLGAEAYRCDYKKWVFRRA